MASKFFQKYHEGSADYREGFEDGADWEKKMVLWFLSDRTDVSMETRKYIKDNL